MNSPVFNVELQLPELILVSEPQDVGFVNAVHHLECHRIVVLPEVIGVLACVEFLKCESVIAEELLKRRGVFKSQHVYRDVVLLVIAEEEVLRLQMLILQSVGNHLKCLYKFFERKASPENAEQIVLVKKIAVLFFEESAVDGNDTRERIAHNCKDGPASSRARPS